MLRTTVLAALGVLLSAAILPAQDPPPPTDGMGTAPPAVSAPVPVTLEQSPVTADCGCHTPAIETPCTTCGPHARTRFHGYYRALRQAMPTDSCCCDCLGGFGPLWETYCGDKQRCGCLSGCQGACHGGLTALCTPCATALRSRLPSLHLRPLRIRRSCDCCGEAAASCQCESAAVAAPGGTPLEIGPPPEPTEAEQPAATPAVPETPPEPPAGEVTSARRGWLNRAAGARTNR